MAENKFVAVEFVIDSPAVPEGVAVSGDVSSLYVKSERALNDLKAECLAEDMARRVGSSANAWRYYGVARSFIEVTGGETWAFNAHPIK